MAASDGIQGGMYDVTLKPRLLRSLLKEYVPDEKHLFQNHADLSHILSTLKTHQLLSEQCPRSTSQKVIDSWKSSVDAWVNRVLALASSNLPDKNWAGICLLGLTFQDCSAQRFLASYSVWFNKIFPFIQIQSDSNIVRVASCASLSDLFTRLSEFNNAKKDGTSHATKVVQALLKLLDGTASDVVWEEAVCLLCVIINYYPSSVGRHYDDIEAAIVSKIMSENCSPGLLEKLAHALAILPKSKGDDESWSLMITKILLSLNKQLNEVLQGFEEGNRRDEAMKLLLPPGKEAPSSLGGGVKKVSNFALMRPEVFLISRASLMLSCCCTMLESPYPVQVVVPVRPLLAIAKRVLLVDGSLSNEFGFMSAMKHDFVCSELPVLHRHSLDLLITIVKRLRSQLLPHVAYVTQFLTEYFGACTLPELRIKLYSVVRVLLTSMGVGLAMYMTQEILKNALMDLDPPGREINGCAHFAAFSRGSQEEIALPSKKKRKHSITSEFVGDKSDQKDSEAEKSHNISTPIAVKIAALDVLEALLTVGGSLRSNSWRPRVDRLLMSVASSACRDGWGREKSSGICSSSSDPAILAEFQLASLRALLASLLSFGHIRPPHLAQALDLFRRGSQNYGTKIAEYSNHALLATEVLIHPRALPLIDYQSVFDRHHYKKAEINHPSDNIYPSGIIKQHDNVDDDDDLHKIWLGKDETEEEALLIDHGTTSEPSDNNSPPWSEKAGGDDSNVAEEPKELDSERMVVDVVGGAPLVEVEKPKELESERMVAVDVTTKANVAIISKEDESGSIISNTMSVAAGFSNTELKKGFADEKGNESSDDDSLPDIVDGDPDTD